MASSMRDGIRLLLPPSDPLLRLLQLLLRLAPSNLFFSKPHLLLLLLMLLLEKNVVWRASVSEHDSALRSIAVRGPRKCVIYASSHLSSCCGGRRFLSPCALSLVLCSSLPQLLPFRGLFRRNSLLRPSPLLLLKSLSLGLRTRRSVVVDYFLSTCIGRTFLIYSVGMSL